MYVIRVARETKTKRKTTMKDRVFFFNFSLIFVIIFRSNIYRPVIVGFVVCASTCRFSLWLRYEILKKKKNNQNVKTTTVLGGSLMRPPPPPCYGINNYIFAEKEKLIGIFVDDALINIR